jgi:SAM-dependent methyltransferase
LARFTPAGDVLELAGGTGAWTVELARYADHLTVVDSSPETLAISRAKTAERTPPVEYVVADLFDWTPTRRYDVVFFSFWLTHVPTERFDRFWQLVAASLHPNGRVFFIDDAEPRSGPTDQDDPDRGVSLRRLDDGRQFEIVKVYWDPSELERRLRPLGFDLAVRRTGSGWCLVGQGHCHGT